MIKRLFSLIVLFISLSFSVTAFAQTSGKIAGTVTMVDGSPLTSTPVSIVGTSRSTLTDENGNYAFNNVAPGNYTLKIQVFGAPEKDLQVQVVADQTATANYQLPAENVRALQEVTVSGSTNKFAKKESIYIARMPLKFVENPQVYNSVPKELIQEQMATDLASIAKNVPGAGIPTIANQGRVTFLSRGFETEPNARNGVAGAAFSSIDPANLERVEAIKGPSSTLFGTSISSSYGGLYNRVTKKPYNGVGGEVGYTGGSWNYNRLMADVNAPINAEKTALFRLNTATTFQKSFQDLGFTNNISFMPSFSYQVTDRLSLLLDVEFGQEKGTSVVRFNPFTGGTKVRTLNIETMGFPYKKTFLSNDLPYSTQMLNIFGQINYKISSQWTSQTVFSRARSTINGYITALNGRTDTSLRAQVIAGNTSFIATDLQQNFMGDFKIANHRNRVVLGLDYYNNSNSFDRVTVNNLPTVSFLNTPSTYRISRFKIDSLTSTGTLRKENNGDNTYAAYVSDVFNITDRLLVMASLRLDRFQYQGVYNIATGVTAGGLGANGTQVGPYGQTALSQKMGAVYEVFKDNLSVFGNYMNGFFNKSGVFADGSQFKPEHANQLEFGLKGDLFNHKLVGTVSYYDIRVKDIIRPDPNDINYSIQDGTRLSKGFEIDLTANPFTGFNMVVGYAYNDSKLTQSDASTNGLRPAYSGPAHMLNFWASYRLPKGNLQGLGLGFGGNSGSSSYNINTTTLKVIVPAYTVLDATVFYDQPKYRIGFKVDNLTSDKTWSLRLTPQAPARFTGNLILKF
ncbi:TonB-dependent receptor [Mucilaginibacter pedocola]|uniref:TonB-dependent receptor n=1 Tax=Mucilaginibacter pedocola TaxID=1792845 RepID=A0A1S9PKY8_9SPHI|nr:TonB-dependent receptor [Mucilaginibacter pedocola]OOQ61604.1 TonB-dependent receptor [Mucilaginibacter pedocola]